MCKKYFSQQPRLLWKELMRKYSVPDHNYDILQILVQPGAYSGPYGFVWEANSCAFDCVLLLLIYAAKLLRNEYLRSFREEFPFINEPILILAHSCLSDDWKNLKTPLVDYIRTSPFYMEKVGNNTHSKVSTATIYLSIFSHIDADFVSANSCVYSEYYYELSCYHESENHRGQKRDNIVYLTSDVRSNIQSIITKQNLNQPNRSKLCSVCQRMPLLKKIYTKSPVMLYIVLASPLSWLLNNQLDEKIVFGGSEYVLFGVIYFGGDHFRVRFKFKHDGLFHVWENDGMMHHTVDNFASKCIKCNESDQFPVRCGHENLFVVDTLMYIKNEVLF